MYAKLAPGADLHQQLVEAARAWRESWAAQGNSTAPRFRLDKWLEREEYDCEPPTGYRPKERKANKEPAADIGVAEPANDNEPTFDWMRGSPRLWPVGRFVGEFIAGDVDRSTGDEEVMMSFRVTSPGEHEGEVFQHRFYTQAFIKSAQDEGQAILASLCSAVGLSTLGDTDELLRKPLRAIADGRTVGVSRVGSAL